MILGDKKYGVGLLFAGLAVFFFGMGQVARKVRLVDMADPVLGAWIGVIVAFIGFSESLFISVSLKKHFVLSIRS